MIADLQDAGKSPDEKQRFTKRIIIFIIEDKWDINNLVGEGSSPQVVLFNLLIMLVKTSQESGWNVSKTKMHTGIIMSISTNEYAGRHVSRRGNSIYIIWIYSIKTCWLKMPK